MSSSTDIDLDRYAEITAHVRHFPDDKKDEVVARLGLRPGDWTVAATRWAKDLETSLDGGRADLVRRYSASFARARRRLASLRPTLESLGPLPEPEPEKPVAAPPPDPPPEEPPPAAESKVAVPSYLAAPTFGLAATPMATAAAAPAPVVAPPPAVITPSSTPPPAPTEVASLVSSSQPAPPARKARTMALPAMPAAAVKLPFAAPDASPDKALERAVTHANAVQGPALAATGSIALGGTADISATVAAVVAKLPFTKPAAAPAKTPSSPFGAATGARPIPEYTVERYASLRVELHEYADRAGEVLARYKLDRDTLNALDDDWKRRFAADPALRSRYLDACERYKRWLRSRDAAKK